MDPYAHPELERIMAAKSNQTCFDCGSKNPKWVSLNNAVFVCLQCAGIHRSFGINISFIRSLQIDTWDDNQIQMLKRGGNERFRNFLNEYNVPDNATLDYKYMIKASDYYRKQLKDEVDMGLDSQVIIPHQALQNRPDPISGLEMLDYGLNATPEFNNFQPICSTMAINEPPKKKGFFESLGSFLTKTKEKVKDTSRKVSEKVKEMDLKDKLKSTGEKTLHYAKVSGNYVVEKGKVLYHSEFVQNVGHKAEEGINVIVDKTKKLLQRKRENVQESTDVEVNQIPQNEGNENVSTNNITDEEIPKIVSEK